jgi:hypothetical protein
MTNELLVAKLKEELKRKDWWYMMADDHRSWSSGDMHHSKIMAMVKELGEEGVKIYNDALKEAFRDEDSIRRLSI